MNNKIDWKLQGSYFEACNCETACPCIWLQDPSEGNCKLLVAWHIKSGFFGELSLDDLNVVLACFAPENMIKGNWQAALYVDDRATEQQFTAIIEIFGGKQGGHLEVLMSFVSEILGVQKVKIDYREEADKRFLTIPGIAQAEIKAIEGIAGGTPSITNPPLCVVSSHPSTVAKSITYHYQDYDKEWQFSDRNGFYSPFIYQP